jgi:hypothetical protein
VIGLGHVDTDFNLKLRVCLLNLLGLEIFQVDLKLLMHRVPDCVDLHLPLYHLHVLFELDVFLCLLFVLQWNCLRLLLES